MISRKNEESYSNFDDLEKLRQITSKTFREQAIWFLNSSNAGCNTDKCELVWTMHKKSEALCQGSEDNTHLDEFNAHRLLEFSGKACTIKEMRKFLASIDPDYKQVSLTELLIYNFGYDWRELVHAPQGYDFHKEKEAQDRFLRAKKMLDDAIDAARKASSDAEAAKIAEETAECEEEKCMRAMEASLVAEAAFSEAKNQSKMALDDLKVQENSISKRREALEKTSLNESIGIVKRNKAKAELAMLLSEDPLPLRSAKLTQEAAVKKLTKAEKKSGEAAADAEAAVEKSKLAKMEAQQAQKEAKAANRAAEAIIPSARQALEEVQEVLEEVSKNRSAGKGTIFYIERELKEAAQFLPKNKFLAVKEAADQALTAASPKRPSPIP